MPKKIRVLRLMEYTYNTPERYFEDMERWSVPANGIRKAGTLTIKSATLVADFFETIPEEDERSTKDA